MPDTGYQVLRPGPLVRPDLFDPRKVAVEQPHDTSPSQEKTTDWPLIGTVVLACTLGVGVWSAIIYNIWGSLF